MLSDQSLIQAAIQKWKERGGTQRTLTSALGYESESVLGNFKRGDQPIPGPTRVLLESFLKGVMPLTGEKATGGSQTPPEVIFARSLTEAPDALEQHQYLAVALLHDRAAAGPPRQMDLSDIQGWAWIHRSQLKGRERHKLVAVKVAGDSMEPVIQDGAIVAVDLDDKKLTKRGIYALVTPSGGWTIKYVRQQGHLLALQAANTMTDDQWPPVIDRKEFPDPIVGRVVWSWQSLL